MTVGSGNHFYLSFGMPQSEHTEQRGALKCFLVMIYFFNPYLFPH